MSRAFFSTSSELKIERNNNTSHGERFKVTVLGMAASGTTLDDAMSKVAEKLSTKADAYTRLPSVSLSEDGSKEKALLLDLFGLNARQD
jgi:hypothetical protein